MSPSLQNAELRITSLGSSRRWFHAFAVRSAEAERDLEIVAAAKAGSPDAFDKL